MLKMDISTKSVHNTEGAAIMTMLKLDTCTKAVHNIGKCANKQRFATHVENIILTTKQMKGTVTVYPTYGDTSSC